MNAEAAESRMDAEVSARCNLSFGRRQQICSEQIVISADGRSVDEVHGLVSPLLTSDLRTFLWWRRAGRPHGHSFDVLAHHCDRILLDSGRFASGGMELRVLSALIEELGQRKPDPLPIGDLNWTRLGVWRTALASLYDVPQYRDRLARLKTITISYIPTIPTGGSISEANKSTVMAAMPMEPILIAGWLASRLGWTGPRTSVSAKGQPGCVFSFANKSGVAVVLSPAEGETGPASMKIAGTQTPERWATGVKAISKVQFECEGESATEFTIRFKDSCLQTSVVIDGLAQAGRVVGCDDKPDGELVAEELDILGKDTVYEDAIRTASLFADLMEDRLVP